MARIVILQSWKSIS